MSNHRPHPIQGKWNDKEYNDPEDVMLYDDCPRCREHAERVLTIDEDRLRQLWQEMLDVEYGNERDHYRTYNEAKICHRLYEMSIFMGRVLKVDPKTVLNDQNPGATLTAH